MTKEEDMLIVAFCARGREIGYVLIQYGRIIRYGVKTIKGERRGRQFSQRVERALLDVLERLTPPYLVVIEDIPHLPIPGGVNRAIQMIGAQWKEEHLYKIVTVSLHEAKQCVCSDDSVTHPVLAENIVSRYPILVGLSRDFAIYQPLYWELVCLAAALADAASHKSSLLKNIAQP